MFWLPLYFFCISSKKPKRTNVKFEAFHRELQKWAGQNYWHLFNIVGKLSYVKRMMLVGTHLWQEICAGTEAITPEANSSVSVLH